jgi:hypothetical protein
MAEPSCNASMWRVTKLERDFFVMKSSRECHDFDMLT